MFSRLSILAARPRHTLGALAVVLAAVGVAVGSGANFTAHVATASNTFATGTLAINTPGTAILTATNMKPGDVVTGTVDVQNSGTVAGNFNLSASNQTGYLPLLAQLNLKIQDCGLWVGGNPPACSVGSPQTYSGNVNDALAALGSYAPSAQHRYLFTATLPTTTDNTFQGKTASLVFNWDATTP